MTPLRQRMLEDMQVRNLSPLTQRAYLEHVSRFARHFGRSPAALGPEDIRAYQIYLTNDRQLAPASIVITVAALRFLYTVTLQKPWSVQAVIPAPTMPKTLPVVLSPAEVVQFLESVKIPKQRVILTTCYAAGLRVSEAVHLTIPAVDSQRMVLRVEQGKGRKDRYVMLSARLLGILREWWRLCRPRHWLFPGDRPGCPITTHAVDRACQQAHRRSGLAKRGAGQLFFSGVAGTERHGHELTNDALLHSEAVEPRLNRGDEIVLRVGVQIVRPRLIGDSIDLPGRDLDGERIAGSVPVAHETDP